MILWGNIKTSLSRISLLFYHSNINPRSLPVSSVRLYLNASFLLGETFRILNQLVTFDVTVVLVR